MALVLKLDEETKAPMVTDDGKIIYYDDAEKDPKDLPLDPPAMYSKISELGKQNKKDRDNYTDLRDKMSIFNDIEDLSEWKTEADKALETVANFNDKDWMKAEKVDKLKADMKDSYEKKLKAKDDIMTTVTSEHNKTLATKDGQIRKLMVSNKFAASPYFTGEKPKTILPPDLAESYFGSAFKVEGDSETDKLFLRAYHSNGDQVMSVTNPGEPAGFNEAIGILIDAYPNKDSILAASSRGGGSQGGKGNPGGGDTLAELKKKRDEALKAGQHTLAISLRNQIFEIERAG